MEILCSSFGKRLNIGENSSLFGKFYHHIMKFEGKTYFCSETRNLGKFGNFILKKQDPGRKTLFRQCVGSLGIIMALRLCVFVSVHNFSHSATCILDAFVPCIGVVFGVYCDCVLLVFFLCWFLFLVFSVFVVYSLCQSMTRFLDLENSREN